MRLLIKCYIYDYVSYLLGGNMRNEIKRALQQEAGQGMTEYIIIVALIAIAAIGVITIFGEQIRDLYGSSSAALSGQTAQQRQKKKKAWAGPKVKGLDKATTTNDAASNGW